MGAEIRAILTDPKTFGLQQKLQWLWLALCNILTAMHLVASVFISASVDFRCKIPGYDNDTFTIERDEHRLAVSQHMPSTADDVFNKCHVYAQPRTNQTNATEAIACTSFVYDRSQFTETTATQFDLVCNRLGRTTIASVIYMAGLLVGSLLFGTVSDYLGRKWTVYIGLCLQGSVAVAISFSPNYEVFTALRFLLGAVSIGGLISQFILMIEICPTHLRNVAAICQTLFWCAGVMLLSGIAYGIRDWSYLQLAIACCSAPYMLSYWWLLEESPAWLLSRGRFEDAVKIVQKIKTLNKQEEIILEDLVDTQYDSSPDAVSEGWMKVLTSRNLLLNLLNASFGWLVASMGYYGLALNVGNLYGDVYLNNFIGGLVEIPAYLILFLVNRTGRKLMYVPLMLIGGVALIVSAFLIVYMKNEGYKWIITAINMIGKFAVASGFELIYFWSAELYPTSLRNRLVGINSAAARVGGMVSPVIGDIHLYLTTLFAHGAAPLIFGAFMVIAAILAMFLPETNKLTIPETAEEANQLTWRRKNQPVLLNRTPSGDMELETTEKLGTETL